MNNPLASLNKKSAYRPMHYNVCMVIPENYRFTMCLDDVSKTIYYSIKELGYEVDYSVNVIYPNCINILIGTHLLNRWDELVIEGMPKGSIIMFNTEQLTDENISRMVPVYPSLYSIWDYTAANIEVLERNKHKASLLKLGYQAELANVPELHVIDRDIDFLFYGSMNERRSTILNELTHRGYKTVQLFSVFGEELQKAIARSKIVLNMHYYDTQIFEVIRVFYLMINKKAIVSEVNEDTQMDLMYLPGIYESTYESMVDECVKLIESPSDIRTMEHAALETIKAYKQTELIQPLLQSKDEIELIYW